MKRLLPALLLLVACRLQAAVNVEGVRFEDKTTVNAKELMLNGAGMRSRLIIKAYAVGLYLPERKTSAEDVLSMNGTKRIELVALMNLPPDQLAYAMVKSIGHNHTQAEMEGLQERVDELRADLLTLHEVPKGSVLLIDWLPNAGTRLTFQGYKIGRDIPGEDFYQAILRVWIGNKPAQDDLKEALLGKRH